MSLVISFPQTLQMTSESTGVKRTQKEAAMPCHATKGKGGFKNSGIISQRLSNISLISTSQNVTQSPTGVVIMHEYRPESKMNGSTILKVNVPSP